MKPWVKRILFVFIGLFTLMLLTATLAAAAGGYDLSWWTVDGGGGTSQGGGYTLSSTLGQPDAGTLASGGGYLLTGGFWHGGVIAQPEMMKIFLPLINR